MMQNEFTKEDPFVKFMPEWRQFILNELSRGIVMTAALVPEPKEKLWVLRIVPRQPTTKIVFEGPQGPGIVEVGCGVGKEFSIMPIRVRSGIEVEDSIVQNEDVGMFRIRLKELCRKHAHLIDSFFCQLLSAGGLKRRATTLNDIDKEIENAEDNLCDAGYRPTFILVPRRLRSRTARRCLGSLADVQRDHPAFLGKTTSGVPVFEAPVDPTCTIVVGEGALAAGISESVVESVGYAPYQLSYVLRVTTHIAAGVQDGEGIILIEVGPSQGKDLAVNGKFES